MPALARIIMNSRTFQRLMERLDTREGVKPGEMPRFQEPTPLRPSERLLPEKGPYIPRMHPLGSLVFRTRFVQRLLGNPLYGKSARAGSRTGPKKEGLADEPSKDRSRSSPHDRHQERNSLPDDVTAPLTDGELSELRRKALISSLLHSVSRWGGR
ncbi:hypothetical protein [Brucella intermedia]|uniref:hypothetical protein n=1 Tax=Brucella intermedia TaxID=94625 RepID=UPI00224B8750|nr:hypothetical protein [Brucella intermedia]